MELKTGDKVYWYNGMDEKLTGTVMKLGNETTRAAVFCNERQKTLYPRSPRREDDEDQTR